MRLNILYRDHRICDATLDYDGLGDCREIGDIELVQGFKLLIKAYCLRGYVEERLPTLLDGECSALFLPKNPGWTAKEIGGAIGCLVMH